jgi:hypothetical protein
MNPVQTKTLAADRNVIAALLSVIPGAGHLYKHHYASGFGFLIGGNLLVVLVSFLMTLGTLGLSLFLVPAVYIAAVATAAYHLPDWHGHHGFLHPWRQQAREPDVPVADHGADGAE